MELNKTEIFERVRIALEAKNLTEVAEILGLTTGAVSQWKTTGKISLATLIKAHEISGVSIHWMVFGTGEKEIQTSSKPLALLPPAPNTISPNVAPIKIPAYEVASLPCVGSIGSTQHLTAIEGLVLMSVPAILVLENSSVIRIEGDGWTGEGLEDGTLLVVRPVNGDSVENRIVVASLPGDRCAVRRITHTGELITLAPILGTAPLYRLPAEDVRVEWIVTSITHQV